MERIYKGQEEALLMTRKEVERLLLVYAANEIRAEQLLAQATNELDKASHEYQKIKARGFKEAIEGLMYYFTKRMVNVENGKLIEGSYNND